jgi:hypothetical protein
LLSASVSVSVTPSLPAFVNNNTSIKDSNTNNADSIEGIGVINNANFNKKNNS